MATKTKKAKASGKFGARYGRRVREKFSAVESKQRVKQKCPYCQKEGVKRLSKGIWECSKCGKKFASDVYYLN
jgi:large subunit ribosomal protein L37Ae